MSEPNADPAHAAEDNATNSGGRGSGLARMFRILRGLLAGDPTYRARLREVLHPITGPVLRRAIAVAKIVPSSDRKADWIYISGEAHTPGHTYRVERYADAARAAGARPRIIRIEDCRARASEFASAHVVTIWRAAWSDKVASIIEAARAAGAKVIFDVDDLIFVPEFARISVIDGIRTAGLAEKAAAQSYAEFRKVLLAADLCTTTTDELAQYAQRTGKPAFVLPNGFDDTTFAVSRAAARRWSAQRDDRLLRIGYATGSHTHQRDFAACSTAVATVLRERPDVQLVLFRKSGVGQPLLDIHEFPEFAELEHRIEWRDLVPLGRLPEEIARFDVNLAPLEIGNPFCEAKSELKYFEAALAGVCTVASATGPLRRAVRHGETGFLAETTEQWLIAVNTLLNDPALRRQMAAAALHDVLWSFGPDRRVQRMGTLTSLLRGGREAAINFAWDLHADHRSQGVRVPKHRTLFKADRFGSSKATVIVPVFNYAHYVEQALDSVYRQALADIDLVVIDDASTDDSREVIMRWAEAHSARFNRLVVLQNCSNAGLGHTRNLGFAEAQTLYVLPLDADNRLLPQCVEQCLEMIRTTSAAFAYPVIRQFGARQDIVGDRPYDPLTLAFGNYIDAMALISKPAWAAVGGYDHIRFGWEDYDFWCKLAERGLFGVSVGGTPLAEYRVHSSSMLRKTTERSDNKRSLVAQISARHPWLRPDSAVVPQAVNTTARNENAPPLK